MPSILPEKLRQIPNPHNKIAHDFTNLRTYGDQIGETFNEYPVA